MKVQITAIVELDDSLYDGSEEERIWIENTVLVGDGNLIVHSNEIGDEFGVVKSVKNIKWL